MMRAMTLLLPPFTCAVLSLTVAGPAQAEGTASPSPIPTITTAGTSFLTATTVRPGQPVRVPASTGDYLYWSFAAEAGQTHTIGVTITLPPAASRHGAATWTVDVFDGLRRRQSCTAGSQTGTAVAGGAEISLGCTLRKVRSWADPWSYDPLLGTYYVRLSATEIPEQDLGLPIQADLSIKVRNGSATPDNASMKAPLSPVVNPGSTLAPDAVPSSAPSAEAFAPRPVERAEGWFSWFSTRWLWTVGGGLLAAVAGVAGYSLTRRPRHWFSAPR